MIAFLGRWLLLIGLNLLVSGLAVVWVLRLAPADDEFLDLIVAWVTVVLSLIIIVQTVLGAVGFLTSRHLLLLLATLALASLPLWSSPKSVNRRRDLHEQAVLSLARVEVPGFIAPIGILIFCVVLVLLMGALAEPSTLPDTLAYHLPMVVDWFQQHRLTPFYLPWADFANSYFPGNGHLVYLWVFAPLGSDLLVNGANLLLWASLGLGFLYASRKLGVSARVSSAVALIFVLTPLSLSQSLDQTLDVASGAFFLLAMGHLLRFGQSRRTWHLVLFSLCAGLVLGTKYSGPAYVALLSAAYLMILWLLRCRMSAGRRLAMMGVFAAGTLLVGGWWYVRNFVLAGNPMYPMDVSPFGATIFLGVDMGLWQSNRLLPLLADVNLLVKLATAAVMAYGAVFALLSLLALTSVSHLRQLFREKDQAALWSPGWSMVLLGLLALAAFLLYLNTPYSIMRYNSHTPVTTSLLAAGMRFSLVAAAVWGLLIALVLDLRGLSEHRLWALVGVASLQAGLVAYDRNITGFFGRGLYTATHLWVVSAVVTMFLLAPAFGRLLRLVGLPWSSLLGRTTIALFCLAFVLISGYAAYRVDRYRDNHRGAVYRREYGEIAEGWAWLWDHAHGSRVAHAGMPLVYPLYGRSSTNSVRYINIAGELDWRHHDFSLRNRYYRDTSGSFEKWLENLREWGAGYLVLSGDYEMLEAQWVKEHPELFSLVFMNDQLAVYEIAPDR
jgi:hypothetical protein